MAEKKPTKNSKSRVPAWLKRIQEGSWEPEILISGIVLFGLFKIYPSIDQIVFFLENNSSGILSEASFNKLWSSVLKYANVLLILGFVAHLFFRSVWVAFVGLSYVYPKGIKLDKLKYAQKYLRKIKDDQSYTSKVKRLERICSTLFSLSFLVFMWCVGLSFLVVVIAILGAVDGAIFDGFLSGQVFIQNVINLFMIIVLIDFITLGSLKRIPYLNKIYYPLYKLSGWLTLSFLYRDIYYGFISNQAKWKVSALLISFTIVSIFSVRFIISEDFVLGRTIALVPYNDTNSRLQGEHYRNRVEKGFYDKFMHIENYLVKESVLEVFVVHKRKYEEQYIIPYCNYDILKSKKGINQDSLKLSCLASFYDLEIDGKNVEEDFIYERNPSYNQDGLISVLDVRGLSQGKHTLTLFYNYYSVPEDSAYHSKVDDLVFYKVSKDQ